MVATIQLTPTGQHLPVHARRRLAVSFCAAVLLVAVPALLGLTCLRGDSADGTAIRRRRECAACGSRFTTYERMEEVPVAVVKRSGDRQPFDRTKVVSGLRSAAKSRPLDEADLEAIAVGVEEELRLGGSAEVSSERIGLLVLERLRDVDQVAYVRFASVYKGFD